MEPGKNMLQTGTGTGTGRPSPAYAWYVVVLCLVAYILSFVDRQIIALLVQPIQADLVCHFLRSDGFADRPVG
jgi:hypothetical protein